jgi:hypothetical protein
MDDYQILCLFMAAAVPFLVEMLVHGLKDPEKVESNSPE